MLYKNYLLHVALVFIIIVSSFATRASVVTNLKATVKNGQVFLTWTCPGGNNNQYKVYRSLTKIKGTAQLTSANYLGYVRDNSSKNIRKSDIENHNYYFIVDPTVGALPSNYGLYVATCGDNLRHFYAVTIVGSSGSEDKTITVGSNSLVGGVYESMGEPQPILQYTETQNNGDVNYEYVIWGNNQDVSTCPAFNNCGSFAYNFTLVNRDASSSSPLFINFYDDNPFQTVGSAICSDCNVLQLDDWLPNGENSYWVGYNTHYDIYSSNNPVQTSGTVRTYTQNLLNKIISWAGRQSSVDSTRVYTSGQSHNGFGAMFTSLMMPNKIAATEMTVSPCLIKAQSGTDREAQWCASTSNLNSDIVNPATGDTLSIWNLLDLRKGFFEKNLPFMSGVNGKNDVTVGWVQTFHWFDSVNLNKQGGVWFWDQRNHSGIGKNFTTTETDLNFLRFSTTKSYPAFAYTTINQNPGNGGTSSGDLYGAVNGYLDWDDASINDQHCSYSIKCFIKDFYVNGVMQTHYDTCTTNLTLRRLQNFDPATGQTINWKVKNSLNQTVQQGSFVYNDANPVRLSGVKIYRTGSTISFSIAGCLKESSLEEEQDNQLLTLARTGDGYDASVTLSHDETVDIRVVDMAGRTLLNKTIPMHAGVNTFPLMLNRGAYVLQVKGNDFAEAKKMVF